MSYGLAPTRWLALLSTVMMPAIGKGALKMRQIETGH
jgi:hypothetical protein